MSSAPSATPPLPLGQSPSLPRPFLCNQLKQTADKCSNRPRVTISINAPNEPQDCEILNLDLPPGLTLRDLKAFFAAETSFPAPAQHFFLNGRPLTNDDQTLEGAGIGDGEMLAVLIRRPGPEPQRQRPDNRRRAMDPEGVRLTVLGNPAAQEQLRQQKPELAAALTDPARWREMFMMEQRREEDAERDRQNQIALLNEDPFNVEAQKRIEEIIRQDRVIENLQHAYENNPEGELGHVWQSGVSG